MAGLSGKNCGTETSGTQMSWDLVVPGPKRRYLNVLLRPSILVIVTIHFCDLMHIVQLHKISLISSYEINRRICIQERVLYVVSSHVFTSIVLRLFSNRLLQFSSGWSSKGSSFSYSVCSKC